MSSSSTIGGIFNIYQGNVGIGTDQPTESLQVIGGIVSTGPIKVPNIVIVDENGEPSANGTLSGNVSGNATSASKVNNTLTVGSYLTGDNFDGSAASTIAVDATDANTASKVVARDESGNFSAGTITATLSGNATTATTATQVGNTLTVGSYLTGDNFDGSSASTIAVDATSANTVSKVVARDASGNFSAGTITATLSGTATQVSNTLTVGSYLTGDNFDGSSASTIAVDATSDNTASKVVARDASGNFSANNIIANGKLTASNLVVLGDTVQLDTITSNTEQMVITNEGTGPALHVTQTGAQPIADFYDDGNVLALRIADGGLVGIGTNNPSQLLHVEGQSYLNRTVNTNNNDINAGSGTITANTFSGTATQVSNTLTVGSYLTGDNFDGSAASTIAVDATDANTASKVVARDASGNFSAGTITASLSGTATQVSNTLTVGSYLTGDNFDGSAASTIAVDATSANTVSKVVARDASGNFSAGTITADLSGTATQVSNTLTVGSYLTGDNFDGSAASTIAVDATDANTASKVVARDVSGNFSAGTITATLSGNATSADQVNNTLTVGSYLTGDNFDGSAASTIAVDATDANTANKVVARDGSGNFSAGTITLNEINGDDGSLTDPTFTFSSDTTTGMFKLSGESGLGFTCGNSEKLRIDSGGNVGIGTNNPTEKLDVNGNARVDGSLDVIGTNSLNLIGTDNVYMNFYPDGSDGGRQGYIGYGVSGTDNFTISNQNSSGDIRFNTNNQVKMLINPDGNVGIGTDNPSEKLHVNGNARVDGTINTYYGSASEPAHSFTNDSDTGMFIAVADELGFSTGGTERVRIDGNGYVGIGTDNPTSTLQVGHNGTTTDTSLHVLAGDSYTATIAAYGSIQGTGQLYLGQSTSVGGGIIYNGDDNPNIFSTQDAVSFYRRDGGTDTQVFYYYYNSSTVYFSSIIHVNEVAGDDGSETDPTFTFKSDSATGMFLPSSDELGFTTGGTERVRINSSGYVGIGTNDPLRALHVNGQTFISDGGLMITSAGLGDRPSFVTGAT